jgi:hypothetical protein
MNKNIFGYKDLDGQVNYKENSKLASSETISIDS